MQLGGNILQQIGLWDAQGPTGPASIRAQRNW